MEYDPFLCKIRFNKNESKEKADRYELKIENRNDELCACMGLLYKNDRFELKIENRNDELCACVFLKDKDASVAMINSLKYKFD